MGVAQQSSSATYIPLKGTSSSRIQEKDVEDQVYISYAPKDRE